MLHPVRDVAELDGGFWADGMAMFGQYVSPWLDLVDDARYQRTVDRIEALAPVAIAGCHTPAIRASHVARAVHVTRLTPSLAVPPQPDQAVLDEIQRALAGGLAA
jgi:hypothetical protein